MSRASNKASDEQVEKAIRANVAKLVVSEYVSSETEDIIGNFSGFLKDLGQLTPRASKQQLRRCCVKALGVQQDAARCWSEAMVRCYQHCYLKSHSMTSGKKLNPHVFNIIKALKKHDVVAATEVVVSSPPARAKATVATASALSPTSRKRSVFAAFGLGSPTQSVKRRHVSSPVNPVNLISDSDVEELESGLKPEQLYSQFLDSEKLVLVRKYADRMEVATMKPGTKSFMVGQFSSDDEFETEIPIVLYEARSKQGEEQLKKVAKKGATVRKKPAQRPKAKVQPKVAAKAEAVSPEESEGSEEESATEDAEASDESDDEVPPTLAYPPDHSEDPEPPAPGPSVAAPRLAMAPEFAAHTMKQTLAAKQSYITGIRVRCSKRELVVAVSQTQAADHANVVRLITEQLAEREFFSKPFAVNVRTVILSARR